MAAVMRLGVDEAGVTELIAVVEHTRCLVVVAGALLLERLGDEPGLVTAVDPATAPEPVRAVLAEIAASLPSGMPVPGLWRALAGNAHHLESTWRKEQVVMRAGALSVLDKRRVALAVAMSGRSRYMIEYEGALVRSAGDDDEAVLEVLGVVDHYTALNTLSDAMQIDSDIRPPAGPRGPVPAPVRTAPAARREPALRSEPAGRGGGAVSDEHESYSEKESAERKLRIAMAAEAKAERAQRDRIKKGFFGCMGVVVFLFIILMLFF